MTRSSPQPPAPTCRRTPQSAPSRPCCTRERAPLAELRARLERLRAQLAALPTTELAQLDDLDARAIELTERRDTVRAALERLPAPRQRRLGRGGDPHLVERTELSSTLGGLEVQLERTLTERAALARQLGDVEAIKDERDGLASAIETARREHAGCSRLVDRDVAAAPRGCATRSATAPTAPPAAGAGTARRAPLRGTESSTRSPPAMATRSDRNQPAASNAATTSAPSAPAKHSRATWAAKRPPTNSDSTERGCP